MQGKCRAWWWWTEPGTGLFARFLCMANTGLCRTFNGTRTRRTPCSKCWYVTPGAFQSYIFFFFSYFFFVSQAIKKIPNNSDASKPDRYRLHLSDGVFKHPSAMLATQLNDLISENKVFSQRGKGKEEREKRRKK